MMYQKGLGLSQGSHAGLIKSYICVSICKALQSLILGYFRPKWSYKVLFLLEKEISEITIKNSHLKMSSPADFWIIDHELLAT